MVYVRLVGESFITYGMRICASVCAIENIELRKIEKNNAIFRDGLTFTRCMPFIQCTLCIVYMWRLIFEDLFISIFHRLAVFLSCLSLSLYLLFLFFYLNPTIFHHVYSELLIYYTLSFIFHFLQRNIRYRYWFTASWHRSMPTEGRRCTAIEYIRWNW